MIFSMIPVTAGLNNLTFAVPASTPMGLQTFARFASRQVGNHELYGLVADGEVEDYGIVIEVPEPIYDFGDAPDPSYPTLLASNGARHIAVASIALGNIIDIEPDGQPSPGALGDDFSGLYDEDGVTFATPFTPGMMAAINVTASAPGYLSAWI